MPYLVFAQFVSLLLDLFAITRRSERYKDLQILLLLRQLQVFQYHHPQKPRVSRLEKLTLAVLAAKLSALDRMGGDRVNHVSLLFKPDIPWLCREHWCSDGTGN